jgi:hypothetical protein
MMNASSFWPTGPDSMIPTRHIFNGESGNTAEGLLASVIRAIDYAVSHFVLEHIAMNYFSRIEIISVGNARVHFPAGNGEH